MDTAFLRWDITYASQFYRYHCRDFYREHRDQLVILNQQKVKVPLKRIKLVEYHNRDHVPPEKKRKYCSYINNLVFWQGL
jgi:hypothetical protein